MEGSLKVAPLLLPVAGFLTAPISAATVIKRVEGGWAMENLFILAKVDQATGALSVVDKRTGVRWGSQPPTRPRVTIPRKGAKADGDLGEWAGMKPLRITSRMVADAKDIRGDADLSALVWASWDERGLHIALKVRDDSLDLFPEPSLKWWERDSVEFWVGSLQVGLSLSRKGVKACTTKEWLGSVRAVFRPERGGYVLEVSAPWDVLGIRPRVGLSFPFAVGINDADGRGRREGQIYFPSTWVHSQVETFSIAVLANASGEVPSRAGRGRAVKAVTLTKEGLVLKIEVPADKGMVMAEASLAVPPSEPEVRVELDLPRREENPGRLRWPPPLAPDRGEIWLAFSPYGNGLLVPASDPPLKWLSCFGILDMPWVGVIDLETGSGCMVLVESPDDAIITLVRTSRREGIFVPQLLWHPSMGKFRYPRRLTYRFFAQGGYVAMCKHFRRVVVEREGILPLSERAKKNPNIRRLLGAPDIWGARGLSFCREAYRAGMRRGIINGRFPPDDMREINRLGFLTSEYDNYVDIPRGGIRVERGLEEDFRRMSEALKAGALKSLPRKVKEALLEARIRADGSPWRGWVNFRGNRFWFKRCSAKMVEAASKFIPPILEKYPYLGRFLDVTTAEPLLECYSGEHPVSRTEDRRNKQRLIAYVKSLGLVVGGEHGRWWSAGLLDYQEGMMSLNYFFTWPAGHLRAPETREGIGEKYLKYGIGHFYRVPLWELCFHDFVVSTWYWGDSTGWLHRVAPEISDKKDAFNILYGTVPLMWAREPTKPRGGYGFTENRERFLRSYRVTSMLHRAVGFLEMVSHEFLTKDRSVQRTTFSDGTECIVNFGGRPYKVRRRGRVYKIPQNGFYVEGPRIRQFLAEIEGRRVIFIEAPGYAYLDAGGRFYDAWYLATEGSAEVEARSKERLWLTLTRLPKSVVVRPQRVVKGWDLEATRVFVLDGDFQRSREARWRRAKGGIEIEPKPEDLIDGAAVYEIVTGSVTEPPDLVVLGLSLSDSRPRQGERVTVNLTVANLGRSPVRKGEVALYLDRRGGPPLKWLSVPLRPGERRTISFRIDTARIDGPHVLFAVADPRGRVKEVSEANNSSQAWFEVQINPRFWRAAVPLEVRAGEADRLDEPIVLDLDLEKLAKAVGMGRPLPEAVRVAEVGDSGRDLALVPAQFEPEKGRLVFILPGRTPKGEARKLLLLLDDRKGAHLPPTGRLWDEARGCAETPFYKAVLSEGTISALYVKVGKEPQRSILWAIMFSSGETGWTKEQGEVEALKTLTNGPARAVVMVRKRLKGGVVYEKTYEFYPRHFVISTKVNRNPGAIFCRLFLLRPCTFEDNAGRRAKVDGWGKSEGIGGRPKNPRWFALYSSEWALSCVALTPFHTITYWDSEPAWGGVGFFTLGREGKVAFVVHPGQKEAKFASLDARRLLSPPEVLLGEPCRL